jgi:hypothetical protein
MESLPERVWAHFKLAKTGTQLAPAHVRFAVIGWNDLITKK